MSAAYEDNFGFWTIDGPEERASLRARATGKRSHNLQALQ